MAVACPIGFDTAKLKDEVRRTYASVARAPEAEFHFHRGPHYAARQLGYDLAELLALPAIATAPFAGVGNPLKMGRLITGRTVIDIGSGAGMDCLLAGKDVGDGGRVIGVDMTEEMLERSRQAALQAGLRHVSFRKADMSDLPLEDESVDVVISNGAINLAPDKSEIFAELYRVVRPGGRLQFADIVIGTELAQDARNNIELWTGWIAGALQVAELLEAMEDAGFRNPALRETFDAFRGTSKESTARKFGVLGANFSAIK